MLAKTDNILTVCGSVDGENNSVCEVNTEVEPLGPGNPYGNAFFAKSTLLPTESEAQRIINLLSGHYWKVVNSSSLNSLGQPVGYKLMPGENILPFAHPDASVIKRAGFMTKHLWVTPYQPDKQYAAGNYLNQHPGNEGLPCWTQANRPIEDKDVVLWYTFGQNHVPFFDSSAAIDVPSASNGHKACHD